MKNLPRPLDLGVFRMMADMSNEAFFVTDFEGRFRYVNRRALDMTGYTWDELRAMRTSDIDPDYPLALYQELIELMDGQPLPLVETRSRRKDGTFFPVEVSVALFEADGEKFAFGVVRDITARKLAEQAQHTFTQRLLETLEAERQRVTRELHDDVGQGLATVGALLESLDATPARASREARGALAATVASIRDITASVTRMVRDYHPIELLDAGLDETVRSHARQFAERHAIAMDAATGSTRGLLDQTAELHLYRIVQEALTNVARHARASRVTLRLARRRNLVVLRIRDDGVGLPARARRTTTGLGLVTMRERAELMGAELSIRRLPRGGTEVRVGVPIAASRGEQRGRKAATRRRATDGPTAAPRAGDQRSAASRAARARATDAMTSRARP